MSVSELQPMSYVNMVNVMLVEAQNELQKTEIMERMAHRQNIRGNETMTALGQLQAKSKILKRTIEDLENIFKAEKEKAKLEEKQKSATIPA